VSLPMESLRMVRSGRAFAVQGEKKIRASLFSTHFADPPAGFKIDME